MRWRCWDGMPPVATTYADAVRLAVMVDSGDYWRNYMKEGALLSAEVNSTIDSARYQETTKEARRMRLCEEHGRRWQV